MLENQLDFYIFGKRAYIYLFNESCLYASVNWFIIVSANGLEFVWHHAITGTKADLLPISSIGEF